LKIVLYAFLGILGLLYYVGVYFAFYDEEESDGKKSTARGRKRTHND